MLITAKLDRSKENALRVEKCVYDCQLANSVLIPFTPLTWPFRPYALGYILDEGSSIRYPLVSDQYTFHDCFEFRLFSELTYYSQILLIAIVKHDNSDGALL